jgi:hypothetical protein
MLKSLFFIYLNFIALTTVYAGEVAFNQSGEKILCKKQKRSKIDRGNTCALKSEDQQTQPIQEQSALVNPLCTRADPTPGIGIIKCPMDDEEFDEFEAAECACIIPPTQDQRLALKKESLKKTGEVLLNKFEMIKKDSIDTIRLAGEVNKRADHSHSNKCSMDTFSEILKGRVNLPNSSSLNCDVETLNNNAERIFETTLNGVLKLFGAPPKRAISSIDPITSLFSTPSNQNQCLSSGVGEGFLDIVTGSSSKDKILNNLTSKVLKLVKKGTSHEGAIELLKENDAYFRKLPKALQEQLITKITINYSVGKDESKVREQIKSVALSDYAVDKAIEGLQNQCGFLMSSLVDLLCTKGDLEDVTNSKFLEHQLGHNPYDVAVGEHYSAAQEVYCKKKISKDADNKEAPTDCREKYERPVDALIIAPVKIKKIDSFLSCSKEMMGSNDFLKVAKSGEESSEREEAIEGGSSHICSFLHCSNTQELINDPDSFTCEERKDGVDILDTLTQLSKLNCNGKDNLFCNKGKPEQIIQNIQKMFITECRITNCKSDDEIKAIYKDQLEMNPELAKVFNNSVEQIMSKVSNEQNFWRRFQGDTVTHIVSSEKTTPKLYVDLLKSGMTGSGYREKAPPKTQPLPEDPIDNFIVEPSIPEYPKFEPGSKADPETKKIISDLNEEIETNRKLQITHAREKALSAQFRANQRNSEKREQLIDITRAMRDISGNNRDLYSRIRQLRDERREFKNRSSWTVESKTKYNAPITDSRFRTSTREKESSTKAFQPLETKELTTIKDHSKDRDSLQRNYDLNIDQVTHKNRDELQRNKALREANKYKKTISPDELKKQLGKDGGSNSSEREGTPGKTRGVSSGNTTGLGNELRKANSVNLEKMLDNATNKAEVSTLDKTNVIRISSQSMIIDIENEIVKYQSQNEKFRVGQPLKIIQPIEGEVYNNVAYLTPVFDLKGEFVSYAISADTQFIKKIKVYGDSKIKIKRNLEDKNY